MIPVVLVLFALIGVTSYITTRRADEVSAQLRALDPAAVTSARFVSDPLRDVRVYDVAIDDPGDREAMVAALHTLRPSSVVIKTQTIFDETKLELVLGEESPLLLSIMSTEELGEVALVSVVRVAGAGDLPAGIYESRELMAWVEAMAVKPGFEAIIAGFAPADPALDAD